MLSVVVGEVGTDLVVRVHVQLRDAAGGGKICVGSVMSVFSTTIGRATTRFVSPWSRAFERKILSLLWFFMA